MHSKRTKRRWTSSHQSADSTPTSESSLHKEALSLDGVGLVWHAIEVIFHGL